MIAAGLVVHEADQLVAQLAMLKHAVGDDPPQLAGTGNQDPPQADTRQPAPLQGFADELARQVAERDVADQEQAPHQPRHFKRAGVALHIRGVVGLEVERADNPQHHGEDAADEHVEEVVDA